MRGPTDADETLRDLIDAIGIDGATALRGFCGAGLYVPQSVDDDHLIARLLGRILAQRLADHFGGEVLRLPRPPVADILRAEVEERWRVGGSPREIASALGKSVRRIEQIIGEIKQRDAERNISHGPDARGPVECDPGPRRSCRPTAGGAVGAD
jgi:hypothetical protein